MTKVVLDMSEDPRNRGLPDTPGTVFMDADGDINMVFELFGETRYIVIASVSGSPNAVGYTYGQSTMKGPYTVYEEVIIRPVV